MRPLRLLFLCGSVLLSSTGLAWSGDVIATGDNAVFLRQARVFVEAERYKEAVAVLKALEPKDLEEEVRIGILTGNIYLGIDRPAKAVGYFEEAQSQAPDNFEAALGAAQSHMQLGQFKQARGFLQRAQGLKPDAPEPDVMFAAIAFRTGNAAQANQQMLGLLQRRPDSEAVAIGYSKYLALSGDSAGSKRILESFVQRNANAAAVREQLGDVEFKAGNPAAGLLL